MQSKLKKRKHDGNMPSGLGKPIDLVMAIGLVWGHLNARQFEEASLLAKGCLHVWPEEPNLTLMFFYAEDRVSAPEGDTDVPFSGILDTNLTVNNPAWSTDPVPGMRTLLKTMMAVSLHLEEGDREELEAAIELVEKAVQMRLRLQQMRRSEAGPLLIKPATRELT